MSKPAEPKARTEPASRIFAMLLDRIDADRQAAILEAMEAEIEARGFPKDAKFNVGERVWVLPPDA